MPYPARLAHPSADALQHASEWLLGDRDVVLAAVKSRGDALAWAAAHVRADPYVVNMAVGKYKGSLVYATPRTRAEFS